MKTFFILSLCLFLVGSSACNKDCKAKAPAKEAAAMQSFAANNNMTAVPHSSGLYYEIIDPGSGSSVTANSSIVITYRGTLLNGQLFDEMTTPNTAQPWRLGDLIVGWQTGIPLIKKGGHIKLLVPSSMAYGCEPYYDIPGNSVLFFDIQLVDVL